jgi:hypothetical protein
MSPRTRTMRRCECAASRDLNQLTFQILVEGHAEGQKIGDACPGLSGHPEHDVPVDDARAGRQRVIRVLFRAVAFRNRRRDAALRPG